MRIGHAERVLRQHRRAAHTRSGAVAVPVPVVLDWYSVQLAVVESLLLLVEADLVRQLLRVAVHSDAALGERGLDANHLQQNHDHILGGEKVAVVVVRAERENGRNSDAQKRQIEQEHA